MNESWLALVAEESSLRIAVTLLHSLWQGCAIGVLVFLSNRFLRQESASSRYALHAIALLLMPLCVVLTFTVADVPGSWRTAKGTSVVTEAANGTAEKKTISGHQPKMSTIAESATINEMPSDHEATANGLPLQAIPEPQLARNTFAAAQPMIARLAPAIVLLYFLGVGLFLLRLVLAVWGGHRLRKVSTPIDEPKLLQLVAFQARNVGLRILPAVRYCERVSVPVVVGVLRPIILLPASLMTGLGPDQFSAIISHELAHVRRHDLLINLLQRVVEATLFFHPVVWYISRRMSMERETCCDELVVSSGYQPMEYANALLRMAELCSTASSVGGHALAASGDHPSQLESRIWRLVHMHHESHFRMTRTGTLVVALVALTVLGMPAIVHSLTQAGQPVTAQSPQSGSDDADQMPVGNRDLTTGKLSHQNVSESETVEPKRQNGIESLAHHPELRDLTLVFAERLCDCVPANWTVQQRDRAFRLLGPNTNDTSERAEMLLWFADVSMESSILRKQDVSGMEVGHLDNTQIGSLFVSRNTAARKLWPGAYLAIRRIQPVEHIAFADLDALRNIAWFDAAYVRDVSIDRNGNLQRLLGKRFTTESGMSAETRFLVVGRVLEPGEATSDKERVIARKYQENLAILRAAAAKYGVRIISIEDFERYTKERLASGRGYPTRWVTDPKLIQPPECLRTGEGLMTIKHQGGEN